MTLKDKTVDISRVLNLLKINPMFREISSPQKRTATVKGKKLLMMNSNDYLGLSQREEVKRAAIDSIYKYGNSFGGSRLLNGSSDLHRKLEEKLASFCNKESALVFTTGHHTNLGTIQALSNSNTLIVSDTENHASIIDGCRLSKADVKPYDHNDMDSLENILFEFSKDYDRIIIIADGVFSMSGELANLPKIVELKNKYGALLYLDDAHGLGVVGKNGKGTADYFGLMDDVDIYMSTLSKALGSSGGFVAGNKNLIDIIKYNSRTLIFTSSLPPAMVGSAVKSLELLEQGKASYDKLVSNVKYFDKQFANTNLAMHDSNSAIKAIKIGHFYKSFLTGKFLEKFGIYASPIVFPAVAKNDSLIRCTLTSMQEEEDIDYLIKKLQQAKKLFRF